MTGLLTHSKSLVCSVYGYVIQIFLTHAFLVHVMEPNYIEYIYTPILES